MEKMLRLLYVKVCVEGPKDSSTIALGSLETSEPGPRRNQDSETWHLPSQSEGMSDEMGGQWRTGTLCRDLQYSVPVSPFGRDS